MFTTLRYNIMNQKLKNQGYGETVWVACTLSHRVAYHALRQQQTGRDTSRNRVNAKGEGW